MTDLLFRDDAYLAAADATVIAAGPEGIELDRTIFYASSGGQPGDTGRIDGLAVTGAVHPDGDRSRILHLAETDARLPPPGTAVRLRARLAAAAPADADAHRAAPALGGAALRRSPAARWPRIRAGSTSTCPSRRRTWRRWRPGSNDYVAADLAVAAEWISEEELAARPEMVKTMKVKPPVGQGRVRLVRIGVGDGTVDLQPCGGTHVRSTAEIGRLRIGKIEKKGRENRRVHLHFAD